MWVLISCRQCHATSNLTKHLARPVTHRSVKGTPFLGKSHLRGGCCRKKSFFKKENKQNVMISIAPHHQSVLNSKLLIFPSLRFRICSGINPTAIIPDRGPTPCGWQRLRRGGARSYRPSTRGLFQRCCVKDNQTVSFMNFEEIRPWRLLSQRRGCWVSRGIYALVGK